MVLQSTQEASEDAQAAKKLANESDNEAAAAAAAAGNAAAAAAKGGGGGESKKGQQSQESQGESQGIVGRFFDWLSGLFGGSSEGRVTPRHAAMAMV